MRPALVVAKSRLESGFGHLDTGIRWIHGTMTPEEEADWPSIHFSFPCALDALAEAADIADLLTKETA